MAHIDRAFVGVALMWLILGMVFGFYIAASGSTQFVTVHITMLLPGFLVLVIYGLLYRLWPAMKETPLAPIQFWLAVVGVLGQVIGSIQFVLDGGILIVASASGLALVAALLIGWLFWTKSAESASSFAMSKAA